VSNYKPSVQEKELFYDSTEWKNFRKSYWKKLQEEQWEKYWQEWDDYHRHYFSWSEYKIWHPFEFTVKCTYCKCQLTKENAVLDHMYPLSMKWKWRLHPKNIVPACDKCNKMKGGTHPIIIFYLLNRMKDIILNER